VINADELPGREKTHIDGGPIGIAVNTSRGQS